MESDQLRISYLQDSLEECGADMRRKADELRAYNALLSSNFDELKARHSSMLQSASAADRAAERAEELREKYHLARMINRQQQSLIQLILNEIYDDPYRAETIGTLVKTYTYRLEKQEMYLQRYYKLIQLLLQHSDFGRALREDAAGILHDFQGYIDSEPPIYAFHEAADNAGQSTEAYLSYRTISEPNAERYNEQPLSANRLESSVGNVSTCYSVSWADDFARETLRIREELYAATGKQKQAVLKRTAQGYKFDCYRQYRELFSSIERISSRLEQMSRGIEASTTLVASAPYAESDAPTDSFCK